MISVPQAASLWNDAGVSTIPILANGTKRPAIRWADYQARIPELGEISRWWGNGHDYGIAVICGAVSGNLEMTELEGSVALNSDLMVALDQEFFNRNLTWLWDGLRETYSEWTPSGGIHLIYRVTGDTPVPGNEKIAVDSKGKVRAETRGEGGYVIVAPTSGLCHPSGESWDLLGDSKPGAVPQISWEERQQLHDVLRTVLDETPSIAPKQPAPSASLVPTSPGQSTAEGAGSRPGDEWAAVTSWRDILEPRGWTFSHARGGEEYYTRPGKKVRDGISATVNYEGSNLMKVFSSSVPGLEPEGTYTKFGALVALDYRGDWKAATKDLATRGFGTPYISPRANNEVQPYIEEGDFTLDDVGNGQRMTNLPSRYYPDLNIGQVHRWVTEEKAARYWDGTRWVQSENAILWETDAVTRQMMASDDEDLRKHANRSRTGPKQREMAKFFYAQREVTNSASDFDRDTSLLNLGNGVLDLGTSILQDHHPDFMLTRKFGANFNPEATAPQWEAFMAAAIPDPEMRAYVQRCLGYTLLGNPTERAIFIVYGPSGTGKSTFLETLNHVFGEYGETAPSGTFRAQKDENASSSTLGLHQLRGKRFVTTSETSEGVQWNEELVKRYTGHDKMRTRALYQDFVTWRSEASIWMATNHAPRFTADDRAIWNRVKLIPFTTVFTGEGQIEGYDDLLISEADGILNWLLKGLAGYHQHGLREPAQIGQAVNLLREQSDSVLRFLDDKAADHSLTFEPTQTIQVRDLIQMYNMWCRNFGERAVGSNRLLRRLEDSGRPVRLSPDRRLVIGVGRIPGGWVIDG